MAYRIYYIKKWRLWIAVIPFRHAYFTEWMAQYKNLLKVISQISLRFPPTDYNVSLITVYSFALVISRHARQGSHQKFLLNFLWKSLSINRCLLAIFKSLEWMLRTGTRGNACMNWERPGKLVEGKNCPWKCYYHLSFFGFQFKWLGLRQWKMD